MLEAVLVPSVHWGVERGQQGESNKVRAQTRVLILRKAHGGAAMRSLKLSEAFAKLSAPY